ncbi:mucin-2-like isoform X2 [Neocloeon triangulifer]|uniref:mucin-2-like isoform X2 n=1 Tax=Neocloeon triangulifer TaxID=2078957 RepID=UPI00286EC732|nr:mucin-2-like isoform X2 [Neocloeon triangulifer]
MMPPSSATLISAAAFLVLFLLTAVTSYDGPGIMQVQVEGFFNPDGRDATGRCCVPPPENTTSAAIGCADECRTFFRVCAARVGPNWPEETDLRQHTLACPLGLLVTPTIANNSLEPRRDGLLLMRFPYREWPGKVKLVIEAWHDVTGQLFGRDPYESPEEKVAKMIVRVERRHKLVFGDDWLRRSVRVNLPHRGPQRKLNRRITFTYALRLASVPDPSTTSTTSTTTTTTTTTTTERPERESVSHNYISSSSTVSYTPVSTVHVTHFPQEPQPQYTPIDGVFLPQSSNAYPLPQAVFTPSTTTPAAPEREFTLLENTYRPDEVVTATLVEVTTMVPEPNESSEDRYTPVGIIPQPPKKWPTLPTSTEPPRRPEGFYVPQHDDPEPVTQRPKTTTPKPHHSTPTVDYHAAINGAYLAHMLAGLPAKRPTPASPQRVTYSPIGGFHVFKAPDQEDDEEKMTPLQNIYPSSKLPIPEPIPYSYPTTVQSDVKIQKVTAAPVNIDPAPEKSSEESSEQVVLSFVDSAIVQKNENGTESSAFATMPVTVLEKTAEQRNATASVILKKDSSEEDEESDESLDSEEREAVGAQSEDLEDFFDYAIFPNTADFL